jgi:hypothetical protein
MTWDQFLRWLLLPALTATGISYLIIWVRSGAARAAAHGDRRDGYRERPPRDEGSPPG